MSWREDVVNNALTWKGTPHRHEAMVKGVGVDCARILIACYEEAGVLPKGECRPPHYAKDYQLHHTPQYLNWVQKYCDKVYHPLPGDIVVFDYYRGVSHGGIVKKWPIIIHAWIDLGVIESDIHESILLFKNGKSRFRGIYRPRKVV